MTLETPNGGGEVLGKFLYGGFGGGGDARSRTFGGGDGVRGGSDIFSSGFGDDVGDGGPREGMLNFLYPGKTKRLLCCRLPMNYAISSFIFGSQAMTVTKSTKSEVHKGFSTTFKHGGRSGLCSPAISVTRSTTQS